MKTTVQIAEKIKDLTVLKEKCGFGVSSIVVSRSLVIRHSIEGDIFRLNRERAEADCLYGIAAQIADVAGIACHPKDYSAEESAHILTCEANTMFPGAAYPKILAALQAAYAAGQASR